MNGNGHANGHTNGHANGHSNGHAFGTRWDQYEPEPEPEIYAPTPGDAQPWIHPRETIETLDFGLLDDDPEITRDWAVKDWFPMLETAGLAGIGGEGKTLLAQMLTTSAALGMTWLGLDCQQMKSAMILCEDRHNDAHWRQVAINRRYGVHMRDLDGLMKIYPRRDKDYNRLGIFDRDGELHITEFYHQLLEDLKSFGARMVVLDTRGDVFKGNLNDEDHARSFIRRVCDRIALELEGLVILLYQPSRAGINDGSLQSGSVQWDATFRSRIGLARPEPIEGKEPDPDMRVLTRLKSNYAPNGGEIEIRWKDGVFERWTPEDRPAYEIVAERSKAERVFLRLMNTFNDQGRRYSSNENATNYAPKTFAKEETAEGCSWRSLEKAMRHLFEQGKIKIETSGPASRPQSRIVVA